MRYRDLRAFLEVLEKRGQLVRIAEPVSTHLEMTEIHRRLIDAGGPAVLFTHPVDRHGKRFAMPVLINLFGTAERIADALDGGARQSSAQERFKQTGTILAKLKQPEVPQGISGIKEAAPLLKAFLAMRPKHISKGSAQARCLEGEDVDLGLLPAQTCWPGEPAPLLTWPMVVTSGLEGRDPLHHNLGIYRMQIIGRNRLIMRWLRQRGGAAHLRAWQEKHAGPMPAAAVIGADPALMLAAVTPIPDGLSEYRFAGLLRGAPVEITQCKSVPLQVPAHAEIVLEGHVDGEELADEGPFGDHTGYYNAVEKFPVFTVSAMTMRHNPVYMSTYTGRPPDEPAILGEALNEMLVPLLQQQFPEIEDFHLPMEGCSYRIGVIRFKKKYPGHGRQIMMACWSYLRQFMYTKWMIAVDTDINARCWKDVMWAISTRMDPARDVMMLENTPIDYLDFASREDGLGSKMGFDATNKWPPETHREWGKPLRMDTEVIARVATNWHAWGLPDLGKEPHTES